MLSQHILYGTEPFQYGMLHLPEGSGPHPVVILIHGGYWRARYDLSLMNALAIDLAYNGIVAWNIEYRRLGNPGGGWPGTFQDVACATDFLRTLSTYYNLDLQRVMTVGHSAGGHLALWLAARSNIEHSQLLALGFGENPLSLAGVISLAGVNDLEVAWRLNLSNRAVASLLDGDPDTVPERYTISSPIAHLPLGIPQILLHGMADEDVPLELSQTYARKAAAAGDLIRLIELPEVEHFIVLDPTSKAWIISRQIIQKLFSHF